MTKNFYHQIFNFGFIVKFDEDMNVTKTAHIFSP